MVTGCADLLDITDKQLYNATYSSVTTSSVIHSYSAVTGQCIIFVYLLEAQAPQTVFEG